MCKHEKMAEKVMLLAYKNGGTVYDTEVERNLHPDEYAIYLNDDSVLSAILKKYGNFYSISLSGGDHAYKINASGIEFAQAGCYSGARKRSALKIAGTVIAAIAGTATIFGFLF